MNQTTITDAAVKAAEKEKQSDDSTGFYVQQLLDAEREKWEAKAKLEWIQACDKYDQLRQQLLEAQQYNEKLLLQNHSLVEQRDSLNEKLNDANESLTAAYMCGLHSKTCTHHTDKERQQDPGCIVCLIKQLLEHKAAIAVKDEALKLYKKESDNLSASFNEVGYGEFIESSYMVAALNKALSTNCGQPLLELVRGLASTLVTIHKHSAGCGCTTCMWITKAKQLGF